MIAREARRLCAAAVRGLAIDALQPGMRSGVDDAAALLRETMLTWIDRYGRSAAAE